MLVLRDPVVRDDHRDSEAMTICASNVSQKLSVFYLPFKNIIRVLFALKKYHRFYLPSQNIIKVLFVRITHYDHGTVVRSNGPAETT
jgi:hypothetical protein